MLAGDERPMAELWAERDGLAQRLETAAPHADTRASEETIALARARETQASITRGAHEERLASLNGIRHRQDRSLARRDLTQAQAYEDWCREHRQSLETVAENGTIAEQRWLDDHAAEVERLGELDLAIARRTRLAGRAAELDRPRHIVDVIGEPPADVAGREEWRRAAGSIEAHAARSVAGSGDDLEQQHIFDHDGAAQREVVGSVVEARASEPADAATDPSMEL
jgi:hypothetical protein